MTSKQFKDPAITRFIFSVPHWMIEAVPKMMEIDKMNERQIARLLHVGTLKVRAAYWWARYGNRRFMTETY